MAYLQGEGRHQGTLFPVTLDDLILRHVEYFIFRFNGSRCVAPDQHFDEMGQAISAQ